MERKWNELSSKTIKLIQGSTWCCKSHTFLIPFYLQTRSKSPGPGLEDASERKLEVNNGGCLGPALLLPAELWKLAGGARMSKVMTGLGSESRGAQETISLCVLTRDRILAGDMHHWAGPWSCTWTPRDEAALSKEWHGWMTRGQRGQGGQMTTRNPLATQPPGAWVGSCVHEWAEDPSQGSKKSWNLFLQILGAKWTFVSKICYHKHSNTPLKTENFAYKP